MSGKTNTTMKQMSGKTKTKARVRNKHNNQSHQWRRHRAWTEGNASTAIIATEQNTKFSINLIYKTTLQAPIEQHNKENKLVHYE